MVEKHMRKKDDGVSLIPWMMVYFFVAVCLFLLLFAQNVHISAKYMVQDSLAAAALAGEVVDLDILSQEKDLVITNLDYAREMFEDSLKASLQLSPMGYPDKNSVCFDASVPVSVEQLLIYNVSKGQVYVTDLLKSKGVLDYEAGRGLITDSRLRLLGALTKTDGTYAHCVTMLDGEQKEICTTSLYARIRFGVLGFDGRTVMVEKDVLTDIQENN